jgi:hypothetical protein
MLVRRGGFSSFLSRGLFGLALAGLLAAAASADAFAQGAAAGIKIELNGSDANAKACRLSFVVTNEQTAAIDDMALELVLFDKAGRVDRFVVVRTAKIPAGKNRVRQFDIPETACADIGRVLLNDVKECKGEGRTPALCADAIAVSTRAAIAFEN